MHKEVKDTVDTVTFAIELADREPWVVTISEASVKRWHDLSEVELDRAKDLLRSLVLGIINSNEPEILMRIAETNTWYLIAYAQGEDIEDQEVLSDLNQVYDMVFDKLIEHCDQYRMKH